VSRSHFSSPEAAVVAGFPAGAVRVVASRTHGDDAYVLLDTRPGGPPYLYGVHCGRGPAGWVEGSSNNAGGWGVVDLDAGLGTLVLWDDAPPGADRVRVAYGADEREEAVERGGYLAAWWRVPCPEEDWPRAIAFRVGGRWVPAP
jgi:hypothetical protein